MSLCVWEETVLVLEEFKPTSLFEKDTLKSYRVLLYMTRICFVSSSAPSSTFLSFLGYGCSEPLYLVLKCNQLTMIVPTLLLSGRKTGRRGGGCAFFFFGFVKLSYYNQTCSTFAFGHTKEKLRKAKCLIMATLPLLLLLCFLALLSIYATLLAKRWRGRLGCIYMFNHCLRFILDCPKSYRWFQAVFD